MIDEKEEKAIADEVAAVIDEVEKAIAGKVAGGVVDDERRVDQQTGIITRHPTLEEKAGLMKAEADRCGQANDLLRMPSWVAEKDGKIIACMTARLVFEVLPFPVQVEGIPTIPSDRAERLLLEACHRWMRSAKNGIGAHYAFSISPDEGTSSQLIRLGWKLVDLAKSSFFWRAF